LSKEAKVALLQQKISQASTNRWIAYITAFVLTALIGFISGFLGFTEDFALIVGVVPFVVCIAIGSYYWIQKDQLMKELERMAIDYPKCPKCRKEIPKGDFMYCPFCSASLKGNSES